jgi:hypothetical protein
MKKTALILAMVALMSVSAWAGGSVDAERTADAFVKTDVSQYEGQFGFTRVLADGTASDLRGDFTLELDGSIPRLVFDGEERVVWGDEPLKGLPVNGIGSATNYWLRIDGWDGQAGKYTIYGWFNTVLLQPGDRITIELNLHYEERFVAFDASDYDSSRLVLHYNGGEYVYDSTRGGFVLWVDPAAVGGDYQIVDTGTGEVLANGNLVGGIVEENIINKRLPAGVRELFPAGQDYVSLANQWFGSSILRDEVWTPAQVYTVRAYNSGLTLEPSGSIVRVEVYSLDSGERVLVSELNLPMPVSVGKGGDGVETRSQINVPAGYDRLVVELIGSPDWWGSFNLWAYLAQQGGRG